MSIGWHRMKLLSRLSRHHHMDHFLSLHLKFKLLIKKEKKIYFFQFFLLFFALTRIRVHLKCFHQLSISKESRANYYFSKGRVKRFEPHPSSCYLILFFFFLFLFLSLLVDLREVINCHQPRVFFISGFGENKWYLYRRDRDVSSVRSCRPIFII